MAAINVQVTDTAADTDALAGTDLETMPGPGLLQIWAASTVNTGTLTLVVAGANIARAMAISLRTNGVPNIDQDPPIAEAGVEGGEKAVVNLGGTTGTIYTVARWTPADEL